MRLSPLLARCSGSVHKGGRSRFIPQVVGQPQGRPFIGKEGELLARDHGIHDSCKAQSWGRESVRGRETPDSRTLQTGDCQPQLPYRLGS